MCYCVLHLDFYIFQRFDVRGRDRSSTGLETETETEKILET